MVRAQSFVELDAEIERMRGLLVVIKGGIEAHDIEHEDVAALRGLLGRIYRDVCSVLRTDKPE